LANQADVIITLGANLSLYPFLTPNLRQQYQPQFDQVRSRYMWETVMQPLINFCESPYQAADKPYLHQIPLVESGQSSWQSLPGKVWHTTKRYGVRQLATSQSDVDILVEFSEPIGWEIVDLQD
jgi:hypothetical protein